MTTSPAESDDNAVAVNLTRILNDEAAGTAERLLPLVYEQLRHLAAARMANEHPGQTLAPTGLVHEVWLRLAGNEANWDSRGHYFAAAAEAMRRILIESARKKNALKHGGEYQKGEVNLDSLADVAHDDRLLQLDEALLRLGETQPEKAQLVKLRYFAGCSIKEAAELMGISTATADRYWAYSRAWLQSEMLSNQNN